MSLEPTHQVFDVVVIGGGITGAGIARDAALRGLACLLLEKGDFSSGTSSKTTRLVHGGLRYLEKGDFQVVAESLRERELLLRMAPHLIHPIPILLPVFRGDKRKLWQIRVGLILYDALSLGKGTPHYAILGPRTALRKAAFLSPEGLRGAGLFYDYQILLPERLVLENLFSARQHGAHCLNYHEVVAIDEADPGFRLRVRDRLDGTEHTYFAQVVVNAAGPWADRVARLYRPELGPKLRPSKGTHIVIDADLDQAVFTGSPADDRLFFTLPLEGLTLVGTTDTPWEGDPDGAAPEPAEMDYLLDGLRKLMPGRRFDTSQVLWAYSGVRPLAFSKRPRTSTALSRRHVLHREGRNRSFLSIVGGKYTTFRKMAEEVVDAACQLLDRPVPCTTDKVPLFGGGLKDRVLFREHLCEATKRIPNLPREVVDHLVGVYGRRCCDVIELGIDEPALRDRVAPGYSDYKAEVVYAVRAEDAHHLDDVILRRLRMGIAPDRGLSAAGEVARLMGRELGWGEATLREELERFRDAAHVQLAQEDRRRRDSGVG